MSTPSDVNLHILNKYGANPAILEDYDLYQAYIILGMRMYGEEWSFGNERVLDKDERSAINLEKKNMELNKKIADFEVELEALKKIKSRQTKEDKIALTSEMINEIFSKISSLNSQITYPRTIEDINNNHHAHEMKVTVENTLIDLLKKEKIRYRSVGSILRDSRPWEKRDGCTYDIELSCIWWGKKVQRTPRRQLIRIDKSEFDIWLDQNYPYIDPDDEIQSQILMAENWLSHSFKDAQYDDWRRDDFLDHLEKKFQISGRKAKELWNKNAPSLRKKPGRKKSIHLK